MTLAGIGDSEIETFSGNFLNVAAPDPSKIKLRDIAHALSQTCRYGGHCRSYYCVPPETKVLTSDFRWLPAGDLEVGQGLFAFEENAASRQAEGRNPRRRLQGSFVTHTGEIQRQIVRLDLSDGSSIRSSAEHPWLIARKAAGNQSWRTAEEILSRHERGLKQNLVRFLQPWETKTSWESGYLAGLFDGEGYASFHYGGLALLAVTQNSGNILDSILRILDKHNFSYRVGKNKYSDCHTVTISEGWQKVAELLGSIRPQRLIDKVEQRLFSDLPAGIPALDRVTVIGGEREGLGEVSALSTTSKTYFADGFGAHNSVAQHSVFVSKRLERKGASFLVQLAGLHHDDAEAFLGDIPRPIKPLLGYGYEALSDLVDGAIIVALDLPLSLNDFKNHTIKDADNWSLFVEARFLLPSKGQGWWDGDQGSYRWDIGDQPSRIVTPDYWHGSLMPPDAKELFLDRHDELMKGIT